MNNLNLLACLRHLGRDLRRADEVDRATVDALEKVQDAILIKYHEYEEQVTPKGAESLREIMLEALTFIHDGIEQFLLFSDDLSDQRLTEGISLVQEGFDIMESAQYTISQETDWVAPSSLS